jgi:hypothetical protein
MRSRNRAAGQTPAPAVWIRSASVASDVTTLISSGLSSAQTIRMISSSAEFAVALGAWCIRIAEE